MFEQLSNTVGNTSEQIAPHWGMLKEAGLVFGNTGINPSSLARFITEAMYVGAGMPWWAALASTALLYRAVFLYPMIRSSDMGAIAQAIAPAQREIRERYTKMDIDSKQRMGLMQREMKYLAEKTGYSMGAHFGPILLQGVFTFGLFRCARNLALVPDLGLSEGGLLWVTNLHYSDPYYIMPIVAALTMHVMARVGHRFVTNQVYR
jgi:YidC/Oxa1 family membrane protein insertase